MDAGKPRGMFGRFAGDRKTFPAHPPPSRRDRGCRRGRGGAAWRLRWRSSSDANEPAGDLRGRGHRRRLPDRAAARPDLAAEAGRQQQRREDGADADGDALDRRQAGPGLLAAVRDQRSQEGPRQADRPVWVLAATYPRCAGSQDPGGARPRTQDLRLRAAEAGQDRRSGLEAERRQSRRLHRRSTRSAPASAAKPRRRPTAASRPAAPSSPRSAPSRPTPKSTTTAKSSKRPSSASAASPASSDRRRRVAFAACGASSPPSALIALSGPRPARPAARPSQHRAGDDAARRAASG